ncbi:pantoate--beta-alanine ligase, partial [Levilactobacillus namurensis]|nr:pantoate--beta-alanine ligase [Levilactobacillus namurensis]
DGLALSSRNGYLSEEHRAIAPVIYQSLQKAEQQLHAGVELDTVLAEIRQTLTDAGFVVDYVEVRTPELQKIHTFNQDLVLFIAVKLG